MFFKSQAQTKAFSKIKNAISTRCMSAFKLNIDVNSTSLKALKKSNMILYAFKDNIDVGTLIVSSTSRSTEAGGTANVNDDNTIDLDKSKGLPMFYSFLNTGVKPHTCGLSSQNPKGVSVPICATIIHGGNAVGVEPIEKVYLVFSNALHQEGTVLTQTSSPGYIVDVTDVSKDDVTVHYDIETGWTCDMPYHKSKCTPVAANQAFNDILNSK
eukprot:gene33338-41138_t